MTEVLTITQTVQTTAFYDEIEIEDFDFDPDSKIYYYPCPCGDKFQVTLQDLKDGEEVAKCPSCSLILRVIYNPSDLPADDDE